MRCIQFYRSGAPRGRSAHDAKGARLHHLSVDDRLCSIDEPGSHPSAVDFDLEME